MFPLRIVLVLSLILVTQSTKLVVNNSEDPQKIPLDLIDDAKTEIENLNQIVLGYILVAQSDLEDLHFKVTSDSINIRLETEVKVETQYQILQQELATLKELALSTEKNITQCLEGNEDKLNELPNSSLTDINSCVLDILPESDKIVTDANYSVDILFNKVQSLEFALNQCATDDGDCINDIINLVKRAQTEIPLEIQVVVTVAEKNIEIVRVKLQNCADHGLATYIKEASEILTDVAECIEKIISRLFKY